MLVTKIVASVVSSLISLFIIASLLTYALHSTGNTQILPKAVQDIVTGLPSDPAQAVVEMKNRLFHNASPYLRSTGLSKPKSFLGGLISKKVFVGLMVLLGVLVVAAIAGLVYYLIFYRPSMNHIDFTDHPAPFSIGSLAVPTIVATFCILGGLIFVAARFFSINTKLPATNLVNIPPMTPHPQPPLEQPTKNLLLGEDLSKSQQKERIGLKNVALFEIQSIARSLFKILDEFKPFYDSVVASKEPLQLPAYIESMFLKFNEYKEDKVLYLVCDPNSTIVRHHQGLFTSDASGHFLNINSIPDAKLTEELILALETELEKVKGLLEARFPHSD